MCALRLGCVSQDQYNSPRPQLFVPVHTLTTHPVPLLFIYISAWMGERRTRRERESEVFSLKGRSGSRCRHCLGSGAQKYVVLALMM